MSSRSARPLVAALLALFLLGACTGRHPDPTGYGDTTETNFKKGCLDTAENDSKFTAHEATNYCNCSYSEIVKQIPFSEFKKINSDLSDNPGPLPEEMLKIRDDCLPSSG